VSQEQQTPEPDRLVRKSDLDDAKADLRREMKLWLGAGSAIGTAIAGFVGAAASGGGAAPIRAGLQALGVDLPL
jgi:hypothetical protein